MRCDKDELGCKETYAPQVTCPWKAKRNRCGKEPYSLRLGRAKVADLEGGKFRARPQTNIGKGTNADASRGFHKWLVSQMKPRGGSDADCAGEHRWN